MSEDQAPKKRPMGLGRGLSSLLGEIQTETAAAVPSRNDGGVAVPDGVRLVPVTNLQPLPNQPRRNFDDAALDELAKSITALGVLQPIVVRDMGGHYQIVAGERRWRAAQRAHLHQVPVIVKQFDDRTALEIALVENIQREELNAWEEGETYRRLIEEYGHSQEELGRIVGKSRSHIANLLRLLALPEDVQGYVKNGALSAGHARALITTPNPSVLARQVVERSLSVRETEALARKAAQPEVKPAPRAGRQDHKDADTRALEADLSANLGMLVRIDHGSAGDGGKVTISYRTLDDLDLLCRALSLIPRDMSI